MEYKQTMNKSVIGKLLLVGVLSYMQLGCGSEKQKLPHVEKVTLTVNAVASAGGAISPASTTVTKGGTTTFTITPNSGYTIDNVSGCGGSLNGTTYTTGAINENCSVTANFKINSYSITASAGSGGRVSPSQISVKYGGTAEFKIERSEGYQLSAIDGCTVEYVNDFLRVVNVQAACNIQLSFSQSSSPYISITTAKSDFGTLEPSFARAENGDSLQFQINSAPGYFLDSVSGCNATLVNGIVHVLQVERDCEMAPSFKKSPIELAINKKQLADYLQPNTEYYVKTNEMKSKLTSDFSGFISDVTAGDAIYLVDSNETIYLAGIYGFKDSNSFDLSIETTALRVALNVKGISLNSETLTAEVDKYRKHPNFPKVVEEVKFSLNTQSLCILDTACNGLSLRVLGDE